jgi:DNA-binding transcriptional regulator of glucitol operon
MDIANYLSELLGRHGKISVPDLGHFTQVRVNGYYNDAESQFYPPGYQIQFYPEPVENDDTLVQYIAEKKNISLASSKYFTEKYITGLKQEVTTKEVAFANLGWFYTSEGQITFKPNEQRGDGADFYGYAPVAIKKLYQEPEKPLPPPLPVSLSAQASTANQSEEYIADEQEETKRSASVWVIALIIIVVIAAAVFGLYQYNPALFNFDQQAAKPVTEQPKTPPATKTDSTDTDVNKTAPPHIDTVSKAISKADTTLNKPVANAADTVAKPQYVIFAGSFKKVATSDLAIKNYKSIGVDARILTGPGSGRLIKVIIGSFATYKEGEALRLKLVKSGKLRKDSYTQIINQKK